MTDTAPASPAAPGRLLLIAGMHRSGTSALARVCNLLGARIPGSVVAGFEGNALGHWEPQEIVDLHDAMLKSARVNVNGAFRIPQAWFDGPEADRFARTLGERIAGALAGGGLVVVKDPRMALFIPLWRRALAPLGVEPALVLPFRDPTEVAQSLRRRQVRVYPDAVWPVGRGVLLWLRYVLEAEFASRGLRRAFIAYDDLLDGWEAQVARLAAQLGLAWPRSPAAAAAGVAGFLSHEHKHARTGGGPGDAHPLAYEVLDLLRGARAEPDGGAAGFDAARARLDAACLLFQDYAEELELRLGAAPSLRTEFVDFLRRAPEHADTASAAPELEAAQREDDPDRRASLLASAGTRLHGLAAEAAELRALNTAILGAAREGRRAQVEELRVASERAEREVRGAGAERVAAEQVAAAHVRGAEAQTQRVRAELDQTRVEAVRLRGELDQARVEAARLRGELDQARTEAAHLRGELAAMTDDRARALEDARWGREREAALTASTSWRLTAPLRALSVRGRRAS